MRFVGNRIISDGRDSSWSGSPQNIGGCLISKICMVLMTRCAIGNHQSKCEPGETDCQRAHSQKTRSVNNRHRRCEPLARSKQVFWYEDYFVLTTRLYL